MLLFVYILGGVLGAGLAGGTGGAIALANYLWARAAFRREPSW